MDFRKHKTFFRFTSGCAVPMVSSALNICYEVQRGNSHMQFFPSLALKNGYALLLECILASVILCEGLKGQQL